MRSLFPRCRALLCLACFVFICSLSGCDGHLIHHWQETSRDYTYIDFSRNSSPYKFKGQVGGEHSTFVKALGFQGDRFTVEMQQAGDAGFTVYGEGVLVHRTAAMTKVLVEAKDSLFTVEISALSYGDYVLTISKE